MLVLSRHRDESIMIGNEVRLVVVEIRGDKVRLGFEANRRVPIHRQEVYEAIIRGGSNPMDAIRNSAAVDLHNYLNPDALIDSIDLLDKENQKEFLSVVDAVLGIEEAVV